MPKLKKRNPRKDRGGSHKKRSVQKPAVEPKKRAVPPSIYTVAERLKLAEEAVRRGPTGVRTVCESSILGAVQILGVSGVEMLKVKRISRSTLKSWVKRIDYYKRVMEVGEKQAMGELFSKSRGGEVLRKENRELKAEVKALREHISDIVMKSEKYDLGFALKGAEFFVYEKGHCKMRFYVMDPDVMVVARRTVLDVMDTYMRSLRPAVPRLERVPAEKEVV